MRRDIEKRAQVMNKKRLFNSRWKKVVGTLACVAVFWTTYALILPAITVSAPTYCGHEDHHHTEECYTKALTCGFPEVIEAKADEGAATRLVLVQEAHTHTEACYGKTRTITCGLEEAGADSGHTHTEVCYAYQTSYGCGLEETAGDPGHTHNEACYRQESELTCQIAEGAAGEDGQPHTHTDACYLTENILICLEEERQASEGHTHSDQCLVQEAVLVCGEEAREPSEGHVHTEACYTEETGLTCGKQETEAVYEEVPADDEAVLHTHTEACYETVFTCTKEEHQHEDQCFSNPAADLETAVSWEKTLPKAEELTGVWAEDVLSIAKSQLGYQESKNNFKSQGSESKRKGYTRYGAMYGSPYADWCAMFIQFSMHYAGVDAKLMPSSAGCEPWVEMMQKLQNYYLPEGYTPEVGDIVFFDYEADNSSDHIGIVTELLYTKELNHDNGESIDVLTGITTIEGNADNRVKYNKYALDSKDICGYAKIPVKPESEEELAARQKLAELQLAGTDTESLSFAQMAALGIDLSGLYTALQEAPEGHLQAIGLPSTLSVALELHENPFAGGSFETAQNLVKSQQESGETRGETTEAIAQENASGEPVGNIGQSTPANESESEIANVELTSVTESLVFVEFSAPASAFEADVDLGGLWLMVSEIAAEDEQYENYASTAENTVGDEYSEIKGMRFFDICVMNAEGEEVKLTNEALANVRIIFPTQQANIPNENNDVSVLHFSEEGPEVLSTEYQNEVVSFDTPGFSVFGVVEREIILRVISATGETFTITVVYGDEAQIPEGSTLRATEILEGTEEYNAYFSQAEEQILQAKENVKVLPIARFFDIEILSPAGTILEPKAPVQVKIQYDEPVAMEENQNLQVVHFAENGTEVIDPDQAQEPQEEISEVTFTQGSFSVTGVVFVHEIVTSFIAADGNTYKVTVTYTEDAQIPEGARLELREFGEDSSEYALVAPLHQAENYAAAVAQRREELIESEVERIMAAQVEAMNHLMSNGDITADEFELKSEAEIRQEVEENFADLTDEQISAGTESLSLIDITILDANGNEVEPKAPVTVEIVLETLPENTSGLTMLNTLQVEHYKEEGETLVPETVASAINGLGEIWVTEDDVTTVTFETDGFSFYTLAWNQTDTNLGLDVMRASVYYGFMISGRFREFGAMSWVKAQNAEENTTGGDNGLIGGNHVYELRKDGPSGWVTGMTAYQNYTFSKAVLVRDGYNGGGQYEIATERTVSYTDSEGNAKTITYNSGPVIVGNETDGYTVLLKSGDTVRLGNADAIQVVYNSPYGEGMDYNYAKNSTVSEPIHGGDSYGLNSEGQSGDELGVPEHSKTLSENQSSGRNDNTYRLSLTATGKKELTKENTKADIILITDYSGSMQNGSPSGTNKLTNAVRQGLLPPLRALETRFGSGTIEISHIEFSTTASIRNQNTPLSNYSFGAWGSGATNYEDALNKLGQIRTRADAKVYVIFITDGNPTVRNSKGEINQWGGESSIYGHAYNNNEYIWSYHNNRWQWLKVSDILASGNWYQNMHLYGKGTEGAGTVRDCYNVTVPYVEQLVRNKVDFSVIATLSGATYAKQMVNVGNNTVPGSSRYYDAYNTEAIKAAFADILDSLEKDLSYKFVSIDDEMSAVAETTLVETPQDFEYFKYPAHVKFVNNMTDKTPDTHTNALAVDEAGNALDANGDLCSVSNLPQATRADFRWADAPAAIYVPATETQEGSVSWPLNTVEVKNETYEVTFTVYPNQAGWDMITLLANHWNDPDFEWDSVSAEKVTNPDGSIDIYELVWDEATQTHVRSKKKLLSIDAQGNVKIASNDDATLTYKTVEHTVKEVDGVVVDDLDEQGPFTTHYPSPYMSVDPSEFKVRKIWKDTLVPRWPIDTVDLEVWRVSRANDTTPVEEEGITYYADTDTGDLAERTSDNIAFVDDNGVTWYWASFDEELTLSQQNNLVGYINVLEPNENLGDGSLGYGASKVTKASFDYMKSNGMIDDENYRINASGERLRNSNGNLIQYFPYWEQQVAIAPGLIATSISPDPLPGAKGHYYALRERDSDVNAGTRFVQHFELDSDVVRPMKRDGIMDSNSSMLRGINARKGELAVTKMVLTQDRHEINPDVPFQVTITLTDKDGNPLKMDVASGELDSQGAIIYNSVIRSDMEYVIYDAAGNIVNPNSITGSKTGSYEIALSREAIDAGASAPASAYVQLPFDTTANCHKLVFDKLYADWTVVLVNLPTDAKWTVQETYNSNTFSNGYIFEGYTLPNVGRGHDTLHPQPHFQQELMHYSGGTVAYNDDGSINEANLNKITDYGTDAFHVKDEKGNTIAAEDGSAAMSISGYVAADAEELVDIHNTRTADDMEMKKIDSESNQPLAGARFVIESLRPQTEWIWHQDVDDNGQPKGLPYWAERYLFGNNGDDPNMTSIKGPAHYPAIVHIHGSERYVVRGNVIGVLYSKPRSEWSDEYTPIPLDRDGNVIENVQWVTVPTGTDLSSLVSGRDYITQEGVSYILRKSTSELGKYEKVPDTTQTHVYYFVESAADGILTDTDPNHADKVKELPIITGDSTVYDMYEIEAPQGYMTVLEQIRETDSTATWDDAKFEITVTSERMWDSGRQVSAPFVKYKDPRTGTETTVVGVWNSGDMHWDFNFSITDKRSYNDIMLKKIRSGTEVNYLENEFDYAALEMFPIKPTGGNPSSFSGVTLYEKTTDPNAEAEYVATTDTSVVAGKTYYLALEPIPQSTQDDASVNPQSNGWVRHNQLFGVSYPAKPIIQRSDIPISTNTTKMANTQYYRLATYAPFIGQKIDDSTTPGFAQVSFSLFREVSSTTEGAAFIYYNNGTDIRNYKNVLNPNRDVRDVVDTAEYEKLKNGTSTSGNHIDANGYLVDSSGARVQHDGKDVLYVPNRYKNGSEDGKLNLVPAVNWDKETLLGKTTNANGRIDFGKLLPGTYWLFEQTPLGYTEALPTKIIVSSEGVTYVNDAKDSGAPIAATSYTYRETENGKLVSTTVSEIVLENTPENQRLPNTGGLGTASYTLAGLLLLAGCFAGLVYKSTKRRREDY